MTTLHFIVEPDGTMVWHSPSADASRNSTPSAVSDARKQATAWVGADYPAEAVFRRHNAQWVTALLPSGYIAAADKMARTGVVWLGLPSGVQNLAQEAEAYASAVTALLGAVVGLAPQPAPQPVPHSRLPTK